MQGPSRARVFPWGKWCDALPAAAPGPGPGGAGGGAKQTFFSDYIAPGAAVSGQSVAKVIKQTDGSFLNADGAVVNADGALLDASGNVIIADAPIADVAAESVVDTAREKPPKPIKI